MQVAVTGATGFVGSHVVAALRAGGHDVRMLVRSPSKAASALEMHGLADDAAIEVLEADLADESAMRAGLDGADAVVHAAAVFSLDPNDADLMAELNPTSVERVIRLSQELGLSRIVYISTMGVYIPAPTTRINADTPTGTGCGPYTASKVAADKIARDAQAAGAPVTCVYPGAVLGPRDPNPGLSDSVAFVRDALKGKIPAAPRGAKLSIVDVRDIASVCTGIIDGEGGDNRYLAPGETVLLEDSYVAMSAMTGRRIRLMAAPKIVFKISGKAATALAKLIKKKLPIAEESVEMLLSLIEDDASYDWDNTQAAFSVPSRDWKVTIEDTARWLHEAGHLSDKDVGALAE